MPNGRARHVERRAALYAADEYENEQRAETEKLLAAHYHERRNSVASGWVVEHRKMPRGWHHALAARHPVTRRSFLPPRAIVLLNALYNEAEKAPAATGARRVFGKTQGFYAKLCGLSMRRGRNGEANGARRVREYLKLLEHLNVVRKGGRCWFDGPGKHPRLVLWILPFEEWTLSRFAEAVAQPSPSENGSTSATSASESDRISRSGCFTDPTLLNSGVRGEIGGVGEKEAPSAPSLTHSSPPRTVDEPTSLSSEAKVRPSAAAQNRPSAGANEGGRASSGPADVQLDPAAAFAMLGTRALRTFRGFELGRLIQHVAKTHRRPIDAAHGRSPRSPSSAAPAAPGAALARGEAGNYPQRPHRPAECPGGPLATGCEPCRAWVAAVMATPAPLPPVYPPSRPRGPWPWELAKPPAVASHPERLGSLVDLTAAQPPPSIEQALTRSIRWERTRCRAKEGRRCAPVSRRPCSWCLDADFPFRASVDGRAWKLRYDGPDAPFTLTVDGCEIGLVEQAWPATWRSFGAPTVESVDEDEG